ncbi:MAG: hypothetical protein ACR2HN_11015 [Tepidiformaceae bacterium]
MTEPLQVGQFAIVDHEPVDRGPNAGVFHGRGPHDDRAELFLVAEGTTPAGESFAGHVVSALGTALSSLDVSLTGSLRRLFIEAERNLREWNRKSIAQHRVSIGLTCFGRRANQAVLAQAGPSAAFHLHDGEVRAYYVDEEHGSPIGLGGNVPPQLTKLDFGPLDRLLLITTPGLRELDDEVIGGILALPTDQVLPDLYRRLQHVRHVTTLLVTGRGHAATVAIAPPEGSEFVIDATGGAAGEAAGADPFQPSLFIGGDQHEAEVDTARRQLLEVMPRARVEAPVPIAVAEIPAPLRRVAGDSTLAQLAAFRQARANTARMALQMSTSPPNPAQPTWRTAPPPGLGETPLSEPRRQHKRRDSFSRGLVREEPPPRPEANVHRAPLVDDLAAERRVPASPSLAGELIAAEAAGSMSSGGSLVRVRSSMRGRWKGGGSLGHKRTAAGQLPPTWLVIVVGLGVLLAVVAALTVPQMLEEEASQRVDRLIDGAQRELAAARVQQDPAEKRRALTDAQALLLEANDASPDASGQLLAEAAAAIAQMDAIRAPAALETLGSLEQFGDKPVAVSRLSIGDAHAFVLDNASGQVVAMPLAGGERKVVFAEDKEAKRGRPIATAWADNPDGAGPSLVIADAARALWAYSESGGLRPLAFAAPGNLTITDIAVFGGELYVLDAAQSVVYRFAPGSGGYGATPTRALDTPNIAAARRLLVDGEIITADADGTLRRFYGAIQLQLSQAGIDRKLIAPERAQPFAENDIAVLDATNDRIVVLRRDGTFAYQYRHKDFQSISAFAMKDGEGYVFSGGKLRRVIW